MEDRTSGHHVPRSLDKIIEEQVRRWEIQRKKREEGESKGAEAAPVITVSREFGALGAAVARKAAKELGFDLWHREIVSAIAEKSGIRESLLASLDERARSTMDDIIAGARGVDDGAVEYSSQLRRVIRTVIHHGSAVIVGRGAQFLVSPEKALRVRMIAPEAERVADFAARHQVEEKVAKRKVAEADKARKAFCHQHFAEDVCDCTHYDLVLNRSHMSVEALAKTVVAAYWAKFPKS